MIHTVCDRLAQGKNVRRTLPQQGRLHIDRVLPFLCVYRRPLKEGDNGTDRLVKGEASYLIAPGGPKHRKSLSLLVHGIAEMLSKECGAFLLLEIWAREERPMDPEPERKIPRPSFRIVVSKTHYPAATVEALKNELKRLRILKRKSVVEVVFEKRQWPADCTPLLPSSVMKPLNCFAVGIEVGPIYRDADTGDLYPMVLRRLHQRLARAIKKGVFAFSQKQTTLQTANYMALGRRAFVKAVWDVDRSLAEISNSFDFLLQATPVNIDQAWNDFKRNHYQLAPVFHYRPLPIDPALQKRVLYTIPIERVEDPTLSNLFHEKRVEIDRELSMLVDRGSRNFLYGSLQLFGPVGDELAARADDILRKISPHSHESPGGKQLKAAEFAGRARKEIDHYRRMSPEMSGSVQIRDDITGLMVSRGQLLVGKQIRVPESRVEALLQHEVGTHVLTYFNGRAQPFRQLYTGLAGYDELQEGLAVLSEYLVGGLSRPRLRLLAGRVVAAKHMLDGASFVETFRELTGNHGFGQRTSYAIAARTYRGGGLTKDAVYLRGLIGVMRFLKTGGDLEPLFAGKIAAVHIPVIRELQARRVLKPLPLRPRYLDHPQARKKLAALRGGLSVLNLVPRRTR